MEVEEESWRNPDYVSDEEDEQNDVVVVSQRDTLGTPSEFGTEEEVEVGSETEWEADSGSDADSHTRLSQSISSMPNADSKVASNSATSQPASVETAHMDDDWSDVDIPVFDIYNTQPESSQVEVLDQRSSSSTISNSDLNGESSDTERENSDSVPVSTTKDTEPTSDTESDYSDFELPTFDAIPSQPSSQSATAVDAPDDSSATESDHPIVGNDPSALDDTEDEDGTESELDYDEESIHYFDTFPSQETNASQDRNSQPMEHTPSRNQPSDTPSSHRKRTHDEFTEETTSLFIDDPLSQSTTRPNSRTQSAEANSASDPQQTEGSSIGEFQFDKDLEMMLEKNARRKTPTRRPPAELAAGYFHVDEVQKIKATVDAFQKEKNMTLAETIKLVQLRIQDPQFKNRPLLRQLWRECWDVVYQTCPDRTRQNMTTIVRAMYHQFRSGAWTAEEDDELRRKREQDGLTFVQIGRLLNRFPDECKRRYSNYLSYGDSRKLFQWTYEDKRKLIEAVLRLTLALYEKKPPEQKKDDVYRVLGLAMDNVIPRQNVEERRLISYKKRKNILSDGEDDDDDDDDAVKDGLRYKLNRNSCHAQLSWGAIARETVLNRNAMQIRVQCLKTFPYIPDSELIPWIQDTEKGYSLDLRIARLQLRLMSLQAKMYMLGQIVERQITGVGTDPIPWLYLFRGYPDRPRPLRTTMRLLWWRLQPRVANFGRQPYHQSAQQLLEYVELTGRLPKHADKYYQQAAEEELMAEAVAQVQREDESLAERQRERVLAHEFAPKLLERPGLRKVERHFRRPVAINLNVRRLIQPARERESLLTRARQERIQPENTPPAFQAVNRVRTRASASQNKGSSQDGQADGEQVESAFQKAWNHKVPSARPRGPSVPERYSTIAPPRPPELPADAPWPPPPHPRINPLPVSQTLFQPMALTEEERRRQNRERQKYARTMQRNAEAERKARDPQRASATSNARGKKGRPMSNSSAAAVAAAQAAATGAVSSTMGSSPATLVRSTPAADATTASPTPSATPSSAPRTPVPNPFQLGLIPEHARELFQL